MSKPPLAEFAGYVSEAGGHVVQDWYDSLPIEEFDCLQDRFNFLASTPITEWKRPKVDKVRAPLVEIRVKANKANHEVRVYGVFDESIRGRYILLFGNEAKKESYDKAGQDLALKRLGLIRQGKASTHEFAFEKGTATADQARTREPIPFSRVKSW